MTRKQAWNRLSLIAVAVLLSGAAAIAQSHPMSGTSLSPGDSTRGYGDQQPGNPDAANYQLNRDRTFVKKALEEGSADIKLAELALQNSQSEDVRQFARKVAEEHKQLDSKIAPIATQLHVTPSSDPSHKDKKLIAKLEGLSGPKFDEEYIAAMLKEHQEDLKDFNTEAGKTQNLALRDAVQDGATVTSRRLQLIQSIAQSHNVAASR